MLNENIYRFVSIVELKIKYYYITDVSFGRIVIAKKKNNNEIISARVTCLYTFGRKI